MILLSSFSQLEDMDLKREPTRSIVVIWVNNLQTELMVEIYSKSLVRAMGKIFHMKLS